jgi:uncharacterized protein YgbK (DUF1537 family)
VVAPSYSPALLSLFPPVQFLHLMSASLALDHRPRIIVIADDLSGAAELSGIAFAHGLSAEVQRQFEPSSDAQVVAVDTDTRLLSAQAAAARVRQIAEQVLSSQPAWIFKKVDSVLRGNPRVEIEAVLQATGQRRALLVPANPTRGRVISAGRYLIDGMPLDQTPFAQDPDHPRESADVQALLGDERADAVHSIRVYEPLPEDGIVGPDIGSYEDLINRAHAVPDNTLAAGAADFFAALLADRCRTAIPTPQGTTFPVKPPALLVCGSRTAWPQRCAECNTAGIPIATIDNCSSPPQPFESLLLGIGEPVSAERQISYLARLAKCTTAIFQEIPVATLLAEGGATASAIAQQLGWKRLTVVASAPAGVGVLLPLMPGAPLAFIKPGSYPWPREIWDAFCRCRNG